MRDAFLKTEASLLHLLAADHAGSPTSAGTRSTAASPREKRCDSEALSSGVVCNIAVVEGSNLYLAHLGDCRSIMFSDGKALPLTVDHRPIPGTNDGELHRLHSM